MDLHMMTSSETKTSENAPRIPKIVHFCFGMLKINERRWELSHYTAVKSAFEKIKPEKILFHYEFEPTGPWRDLTKPLVTLNKINAPRSICGNPVDHPAHRADVVRLEQLVKHGGIYLDCDVIVHRPFDDLLGYSTVLGNEGRLGRHGMANAIILAEPDAPFIKRWLSQ